SIHAPRGPRNHRPADDLQAAAASAKLAAETLNKMDNIMSRLDTIDAIHCNLTEAIARIDIIDDCLARIKSRLGIPPIKYTDDDDDINGEAHDGRHTIPSCHLRDYEPTANWDESINSDVQSLLD